MCISDGVNMGISEEGFHQEVILELILKCSHSTDGKRHFRQTSAKAGGKQDCGVLRELSGEIRVRVPVG